MNRSLNILFVALACMVPASLAQAQPASSSVKHTCKLQPGQKAFANRILEKYNFTPSVVHSWLIVEMSGSAAAKRQHDNNHNWLNLGAFDSGNKSKPWGNPVSAADRTLDFIKTGRSSIRNILRSAGKSTEAQISAIAGSGWAASGYHNGNDLRRARAACTFL